MSSSPDAARLRSLALALLPGVGPTTYREQRERYGSASAAFDATTTRAGAARALAEAIAIFQDAARLGVHVVLLDDPAYPARLAELADAPPYLHVLGHVPVLTARTVVAVVGTREATAYGERVARHLAGALAAAGAVVVSGMARGIDAAAHRAALASGGTTVAVLGTGVDVPYPRVHTTLHAGIGETGAVISELRCGTRATPGAFPRRNRIIAALAEATIVVEAGARSGALITADIAADLGRTVAAVPGPIDVAQSEGANRLLRDGAVVIPTADDALTLLGLSPRASDRAAPDDPVATAILRALADGPADADALAARSGLTARSCLTALSALEVGGYIECLPSGEMRRV